MPKPKKNTPDNSVLFQKSHFNTTIPESDNMHAVERRTQGRMSSPECRKDIPPIIGTHDPAMLRRAKLKRIAQDGPNSNDTAADVLESGWKAREWTEVVRERYA